MIAFTTCVISIFTITCLKYLCGLVAHADEGIRNKPSALYCWICLRCVAVEAFKCALLIVCPGLISVSFTYPLDLIRVRMAFKTRRTSPELQATRTVSLVNAMREIYREGAHSKPPSSSTLDQSRIFSRFPFLSFYRGFSVTMLGIIPYAGTNFLAWGYLRATFLPPKTDQQRKKSTPVADLVIGAISGASGQTVSYPLEVIRRRMQVGGLTQPDRWIGFGETVRLIWATSGWRGFYVGLSIGYLKIVPMTATSFAVWQWAKRLLDMY